MQSLRPFTRVCRVSPEPGTVLVSEYRVSRMLVPTPGYTFKSPGFF